MGKRQGRGILVRLLVVICLILAGALPGWGGVNDGGAKATGKYVAGELLVKFRPGTNAVRKDEVNGKIGARKLREFASLGLQRVKIPGNLPLDEAIRRYQADAAIEYAEPNYIMKSQAVPSDPRFGELWGMQNTGQTGGIANADINAAAAWNLTTGSSSVVVAVIDTGVDYNHEDLRTNMWVNSGEIPGNGIDDDGNGYVDDVYGIDAFNGDGDPIDDHFHGTHVAGTIGASANNGIGVAGVNWSVRIMACKFLDSSGTGPVSDAIECLEYIKGMKARGVNIVATSNSWGGGDYSLALRDAIDAQREILFVAAAGNDYKNNDLTPSYPASYGLPSIIAVAATNASDQKADFSNYGRRSVHVGAPGVDILSTAPGNGYQLLSGTSMATPHVTGLVALLKASQSSRDWRAIRNLVLAGADPVPALTDNTLTGRRIDAYGSLTCGSASLFAVSGYPLIPTIGSESVLSALSITCDHPVGPVIATLASGQQITLHDDGAYPDLAAGDGIFAAAWTPTTRSDSISFTSPLGSETVQVQFPPLKINTQILPEAMVNEPYSATITATGGVPPFTWSISVGALPPGFSLNASTGTISGVTSQTGLYRFTIRVSDTDGAFQATEVALSVAGDLFSSSWTRLYDAGDKEQANAVTTDRSGNVYVAGEKYIGSYRDIVISKYDASGTLLWTRSYDSGSDDTGTGVAVDASGVYVTGNASTNCITLKYDAAGTLLWSRNFPEAYGRAIAVSRRGEVYVTGRGGSWPDNMIVIKYDPNGNQVWSQIVLGDSVGYGIAVDADGDAYATGIFTGDVIMGMEQDLIISRIGWDGTIKWTTVNNGAFLEFDHQTGQTVAVDESGNSYVGGVKGDIVGYDYLIMKFDPAGALLWTRRMNDGEGEVIYGLTVDGAGNLYAVGHEQKSWNSTIQDNVRVMKFDPSSLLLSKSVFDLGSDEFANAISLDPWGNVIVAGGAYNGQNNDMLVMKLTQATPFAVASPAILPDGAEGEEFAFTITALGATASPTWSVIQGALPAGITLNQSTGALSGKPATAGTYLFTVEGRLPSGSTATKALSLRVNPTYYIRAMIGGKIYKSGPQYAQVRQGGSDKAIGDTISWTYTGGPMNHLVGYLANGGYQMDAVIRGAAAGVNLSFYSKDAAGTGYVNLVEANPVTGAVVKVLSTIAVPLQANKRVYVTNLSGLQGTVHYGNTVGIMLSTTTSGRSLTETRWGKTNGGPGYEQWFSFTEKLIPVNHPPVVELNGPYSGYQNQSIALSIAGTYDPDGDDLAYHWEFGDGSYSDTTSTQMSHIYYGTGTFTVRLTATDSRGASSSDTATVTVTTNNQAPVANAGPDISAAVRASVTLDGSASYDPDGMIYTYSWNLGDGKTVSGPVVSTSYRRAGTYLVTLTVTDNLGGVSSDTCSVTVK